MFSGISHTAYITFFIFFLNKTVNSFKIINTQLITIELMYDSQLMFTKV